MIALSTVSSGSQATELLLTRWVTAQDHSQAQRRQSKVIQQNFLIARAVLRALLARVTGTDEWQICPDVQGKPQALTASGIVGPYISLSHTQGLIACAVSQKNQFGIDVEHWRTRDFAALADFAFGPREREEVARDGMSAFYRIWTLREAVSKATGQGLIATIDGHDCVADAPTSGCWATESWRLFYISPQTNYSLAIASEGKGTWSEASLTWIDVTTCV